MRLEKGFSLLELLIAIAILGLLAAISFPSYKEQVTRSRRADAKVALYGIAEQVERHYSENYSYDGISSKLSFPHDSSQGYYKIDIVVPDPTRGTGFLLTATPQKGQEVNDLDCQSFTFSDTGVENIANGPRGAPSATADRCWS